MEVLVIAAVVVASACVVLMLKRSRENGRKPVPGPKSLPLLGNVHQIDKLKQHVTWYEWGKLYGDMFQFTMFGHKFVMLNCPELFESVFGKFTSRPHNVFSDINHEGNGAILGNNMFLIRELKQSVINVTNDETLQKSIEEEVTGLINHLKKSAGSDVDLVLAIKKTVSSQMLIAILGCKPGDADVAAVWTFMTTSGEIFKSGTINILTAYPWLKYIPGTKFKRLYDLSKRSIANMINELTKDAGDREKNGRGMIAQLVKRKAELEVNGNDKEALTDMNINGIIVDCIVAGIPQWYTALVCGLLNLAKNEHVQNKMHAELDKVCDNYHPTLADRDKLPYLNAAVLEIYRYSSSLSTTLPHLVTEDTEINGFFLEKGTEILGNLCNLHHSDAIWTDAWEFQPERFIDESGELLPAEHPLRKSVRPYGNGLRNCKGYSLGEPLLFMCVAQIIYHFKLLPPMIGELPDNDPRSFNFAPALILPEINCRFEPRITS